MDYLRGERERERKAIEVCCLGRDGMNNKSNFKTNPSTHDPAEEQTKTTEHDFHSSRGVGLGRRSETNGFNFNLSIRLLMSKAGGKTLDDGLTFL